ncbi:hypothetical protein D3C74_301790 [compost metagenome]
MLRHIFQNAVANALMRYMAQVFLHPLDSLPDCCLSVHIQQHRILACKPAHGTGDVDIWNNGFPAMSLQIDQHTLLTAPVIYRCAECG